MRLGEHFIAFRDEFINFNNTTTGERLIYSIYNMALNYIEIEIWGKNLKMPCVFNNVMNLISSRC